MAAANTIHPPRIGVSVIGNDDVVDRSLRSIQHDWVGDYATRRVTLR